VGKKHKHPEHENLERWLVSYADFITLLFATFVVLYALSQADLQKFKLAGESIKSAFNPGKSVMENPGGVMTGTPDAGVLKQSGNSILEKTTPKYPVDPQKEGGDAPLSSAVSSVDQQINKMNAAAGKGKGSKGPGGKGKGPQGKDGSGEKEGGGTIGLVQVRVQERGVVISLESSLFFEPGQAGLKPEAYDVLSTLGKSLKNTGKMLHIEGHTDGQPIASAVYPSNWELSTARASSVLRFFERHSGISGDHLAAVGYGASRPIAPNTSPEGRQKNRRVDIVILAAEAEKQADAGAAQLTEQTVILDKESH
jgi:chemotaxis protein MotB